MVADLLKGAIDVHVHAAPSLFPRRGDGHAVVAACEAHGMAGVVLKSHHGSSVEMAAAVQVHHPASRVMGGLVLNHFVGGLNPHAVDAAVALGAKMVWLPTIHAHHHAVATGHPGGFDFQRSSLRLPPPAAISLLDEGGKLVAAVADILDVLRDRDVVLASGHVGFDELSVLRKHVLDTGGRVRLLVNHVRFFAPGLRAEQICALAGAEIWFELCFFTTCPMAKAASVGEIAALLVDHPNLPWVLASDAGQVGNPSPPEALTGFCVELLAAGAPLAVVRRALIAAPRALLALS